MKFEKNNKYFTIAAYVVICSIIVVVFFSLCFNFGKVSSFFAGLYNGIKPIFYAVIMAFIFSPIERFAYERIFFQVEEKYKRPKLRRALSLLLTYIIVTAVLISFISLVIPQLISSYKDLEEKAPEYIDDAQKWLAGKLDFFSSLDFVINLPADAIAEDVNMPEVVPIEYMTKPVLTYQDMEKSPLYQAVKEYRESGISFNLVAMLQKLLDNSYELLDKFAPYLLSFLGNLFTELKNLLLGLIISVYILASRKKLGAQFKKVCAAVFPEGVNDRLNRIWNITNTTFVEFINGKLLDALVIGILCFIAMNIFKMPYALLISVLVGVTNMIPFIGPFLGAVPGAFIIFIFSPMKAVWFIVMIIAIQQLDMNLIEPRIVGNKTGLPAFLVITAVIVMGGIFGVAGLFIGVPVVAVIYALLSEWTNQRLSKRGLPTEISAYEKEV